MNIGTKEYHEKISHISLTGWEVHDMIIDALKARGIDCDGSVVISYHIPGGMSRCHTSRISSGFDAYVEIRKPLRRKRNH